MIAVEWVVGVTMTPLGVTIMSCFDFDGSETVVSVRIRRMLMLLVPGPPKALSALLGAPDLSLWPLAPIGAGKQGTDGLVTLIACC